MVLKKSFIFEVEDGFAIDGIGVNVSEAFRNAKANLSKMNRINKSNFLHGKKLTGRYNVYDKDGFVRTGEFPKKGVAMAEDELERILKKKFAGYSTERLVKRMESAEDFKYDDEEVELTRRLREKGKKWKWDENSYTNKVIIFDEKK